MGHTESKVAYKDKSEVVVGDMIKPADDIKDKGGHFEISKEQQHRDINFTKDISNELNQKTKVNDNTELIDVYRDFYN